MDSQVKFNQIFCLAPSSCMTWFPLSTPVVWFLRVDILLGRIYSWFHREHHFKAGRNVFYVVMGISMVSPDSSDFKEYIENAWSMDREV
jgi:hypothetical protein